MMKEVALDTETTGLDVAQQHRIIEIGCVELVSGQRSGKTFHAYVNPFRAVSPEAFEIHGLSDDFLRDQPAFSDIVATFLDFIKDARLIIHNAEFDLGFLNAELAASHHETLNDFKIVDTLSLAREKFPNQSNRLDALCQRFGIDISQRAKHGALLDASLLAEVYIALTAGEQASLIFAPDQPSAMAALPARAAARGVAPPQAAVPQSISRPISPFNEPRRPQPKRLTAEEMTAHQDFIKAVVGKNALWASLWAIKGDITKEG